MIYYSIKIKKEGEVVRELNANSIEDLQRLLDDFPADGDELCIKPATCDYL